MRRIRILSDGEQGTAFIAGTEVRVATVLAFLEQGWSFRDIRLLRHPEITAADIRACVQYAQRCPGATVKSVDCELARPARYHPGFWFEFGMPLLLTTLLSALFLIYFQATNPAGSTKTTAPVGVPSDIQSPALLTLPFKRQGDAAYASEQFGDAERWYLKALEADPKNAAVGLNLGLTYYREKRYAEAETQYRRAAALEPEDATAHYDLGLLLSAQRRSIEAGTEFTLALALKPEDSDFRYSLGKVFCDQRRYEDAIPQFEHALRIEPVRFGPSGAAVDENAGGFKNMAGDTMGRQQTVQ